MNVKEKFKEELLEYCVPFWLEHGVDKEYGGIINCLDRYGKIYSEDKSVHASGYRIHYGRLRQVHDPS